jgi:hypothetical protein
MFELKDAPLLKWPPPLPREWHAGNESHVDPYSCHVHAFTGNGSRGPVAAMALKEPQARRPDHTRGLCAPVGMQEKPTIRGVDDVGRAPLAHLTSECRESLENDIDCILSCWIDHSG